MLRWKKSPTVVMLVMLAGGFTAVLCTQVAAANLNGRVVAVTDGDTVRVLDIQRVEHRIRLAGIDAPEKTMPFGQMSKQALSALIFGQEVVVKFDKLDRYGRAIGKVMKEDRDVNLELLRQGMAWHYKRYETEQTQLDRELYAEAEQSARASKTGLWSEANPTPPWEYRRVHRTGVGR